MLQIEKIGYDKLEVLLSMYREKAEWLNRIMSYIKDKMGRRYEKSAVIY